MVIGAPSTETSNVLFGSFSEMATLVPSNRARRPMGPQLPAGLLWLLVSHRPKYWIPGGRALPASEAVPELPEDPPDVLPLDPLAGEPPLDEEPLDGPLPELPLDDVAVDPPPEDVLPPVDPPPSSPVAAGTEPEDEQYGSSAIDVATRANRASVEFTGTSSYPGEYGPGRSAGHQPMTGAMASRRWLAMIA
jgi:hypothetical protein